MLKNYRISLKSLLMCYWRHGLHFDTKHRRVASVWKSFKKRVKYSQQRSENSGLVACADADTSLTYAHTTISTRTTQKQEDTHFEEEKLDFIVIIKSWQICWLWSTQIIVENRQIHAFYQLMAASGVGCSKLLNSNSYDKQLTFLPCTRCFWNFALHFVQFFHELTEKTKCSLR